MKNDLFIKLKWIGLAWAQVRAGNIILCLTLFELQHLNLKANSSQMNIKAYWDYFISRYNEAIHGLFDKKGTNATKSLKRENKNRWERKMLTVRPIGLKETCQPDKSSTYTLYCNTCRVVLRKVLEKKMIKVHVKTLKG